MRGCFDRMRLGKGWPVESVDVAMDFGGARPWPGDDMLAATLHLHTVG